MDRELVERAQHGDRAAYEALVRDSARRLFLVCHRILRDRDQAEDATQQALVEMWRDLRGLRDPDRFEAWTYRIAVRWWRSSSAGFAPTDDPRSYRMTRQSPPTAFDVRTGAWFALVDGGP